VQFINLSPSISPLFCFQNSKFFFTNYMHTCLLILLFFMTFGHSKLVRQHKCNYQLGLISPPTDHFCFTAPREFLTAPRGAVPPTLGTTAVGHYTAGVSTCPTLRGAKHFPSTSYSFMLGVYTVSTYFCYTKAILIRRKPRNNSRTTTAFGIHTGVLNN